MADLWYAVAAACLTAYVVLDGFDLGAGMLHRATNLNEQLQASPYRALVVVAVFRDGHAVDEFHDEVRATHPYGSSRRESALIP